MALSPRRNGGDYNDPCLAGSNVLGPVLDGWTTRCGGDELPHRRIFPLDRYDCPPDRDRPPETQPGRAAQIRRAVQTQGQAVEEYGWPQYEGQGAASGRQARPPGPRWQSWRRRPFHGTADDGRCPGPRGRDRQRNGFVSLATTRPEATCGAGVAPR